MKKIIIVLLILFSVSTYGKKYKYTYDEYQEAFGTALTYNVFFLLESLAEYEGSDQSKIKISDASLISACTLVRVKSKVKNAWEDGVYPIKLISEKAIIDAINKCILANSK